MKLKLFLRFLLVFFSFFSFLIFFPVKVSQKKIVDIAPGEYFHNTLNDLKKKGLIRSLFLTKGFSKLFGFDKKVKAGEYLVDKNINLISLLKLLSSGKTITYTLTFPEGSNLYEMADKLEKEGLISKEEFLKVSFDQDYIEELLGERLYSFEGYLFPETYTLTKYMGAKKLIKTMVEQFLKTYKKIRPLETDLARTF